jgi:hypothetical protein
VYVLIEDDPQPGNFSEISKYPKFVGVVSSSSSPFELGIPCPITMTTGHIQNVISTPPQLQ